LTRLGLLRPRIAALRSVHLRALLFTTKRKTPMREALRPAARA
jgi:hypothetical protein